MKIVELRHPLVQHKLGHMRDIALDPARFRQFAGEIGSILAYEACRDRFDWSTRGRQILAAIG